MGHLKAVTAAPTMSFNTPFLTEAQATGQACIRCHRTDRPMVPAGVHFGAQVFECTQHGDTPAPVTEEQDLPLPATEDQTVEVLAGVRAELSELEVRVSYTAGYLSAVVMLAERLRAAGVDAPVWEEYAAAILTDEERLEVAQATKQIIARRRTAAVTA